MGNTTPIAMTAIHFSWNPKRNCTFRNLRHSRPKVRAKKLELLN
jgi:hypothetical protein